MLWNSWDCFLKRLSGKIRSEFTGTGCLVSTWILLVFSGLISMPGALSQSKGNLPEMTGNDFISMLKHFHGSDDELVNGPLYIPKSDQIAGHPYFLTDEWSDGSVFIHGYIYDDLELKYNLEIEELILNAYLTDGTIIKILLNSRSIDSFYIQDHFFVNSREFFPSDSVITFYEVIYRKNIAFVAHLQKVFVPDYSNTTPFGKFSDLLVKYFIFKEHESYKVSTKRMFLNYWDPYQRQIKKFMRRNKINYKKAGNNQLKLLLNFCSQVSSE